MNSFEPITSHDVVDSITTTSRDRFPTNRRKVQRSAIQAMIQLCEFIFERLARNSEIEVSQEPLSSSHSLQFKYGQIVLVGRTDSFSTI